jgi:hypothetical protein
LQKMKELPLITFGELDTWETPCFTQKVLVQSTACSPSSIHGFTLSVHTNNDKGKSLCAWLYVCSRLIPLLFPLFLNLHDRYKSGEDQSIGGSNWAVLLCWTLEELAFTARNHDGAALMAMAVNIQSSH